MYEKKILTDASGRELSAHGTEGFPVTVNRDDLRDFEGGYVPIHWHNELEICLPRSGRAVYQIYQSQLVVQPGQALLINSNVPHSCRPAGAERALYSSIIVQPAFLYGALGTDIERLYFRPFLHNHAVPSLLLSEDRPEGQQVIALLRRVDALFHDRPPYYQLELKGLLCQVFALFLAAQPADTPFIPQRRDELERLDQMLRYLHAHDTAPLSLQALADAVHLSRESCCRHFRKMTGQTISQYLEDYRVNESLTLLQSGQLSIAQIAEATGFSSASRFSQAFRQRIGCNPSAYRNARQSGTYLTR